MRVSVCVCVRACVRACVNRRINKRKEKGRVTEDSKGWCSERRGEENIG